MTASNPRMLNWFDKLCAAFSISAGATLMGFCVFGLLFGGTLNVHSESTEAPRLFYLLLFPVGWGMSVTFLKVWRARADSRIEEAPQ